MSDEIKLNCWKFLKSVKPQRRDETGSNVMVVKTEKINRMVVWLNPNPLQTMDNQQVSLEQRKLQRLSRKRVHRKRLTVEVVCLLEKGVVI